MSSIHLELLSWLGDAVVAERTNNRLVLELDILDNCTVKKLLRRLANLYPRLEQTVFNSKTQKLNGAVGIIYNNQILELVNGLETRLKDHDILVFYPIFVGG
jgi:molybdopterin converting factor small subunit